LATMFFERPDRGEIRAKVRGRESKRKREKEHQSRVHPSLGDEVEAERFAKERCTRDLHPPTRDEKTWPTTRITERSAIVFVIDYLSSRKLGKPLQKYIL